LSQHPRYYVAAFPSVQHFADCYIVAPVLIPGVVFKSALVAGLLLWLILRRVNQVQPALPGASPPAARSIATFARAQM
jgi:hypothetical protein